MDIRLGFLLYDLVFHLALLSVGLVFVLLGYRLFDRQAVGPGGMDIDAQFLTSKIKIRKATAGTAFALLGCIELAFTIVDAAPRFQQKRIDAATGSSEELVLRGDQPGAVTPTTQALIEQAIKAERAGDDAVALRAYA